MPRNRNGFALGRQPVVQALQALLSRAAFKS